MKIDKKERKFYSRVHNWMRKTYGKPNKCEGVNCKGIKARMEWALIKGKKYDFKRENFIRLCRSCHSLYDLTDETREKLRLLYLGKPKTKEHKLRIGLAKRGKPNIKCRKKVYMYEDGKLVNVYNSVFETAKAFNKSHSLISTEIIRGCKFLRKYQLTYEPIS